MKIKYIIEEDIINYKKCSMFVAMPYCSFKCEKECGIKCCQNSSLALAPIQEIEIKKIIESYKQNIFTNAIVFGGLEPLDSWEDLLSFIRVFREESEDDIVIYTGYNEYEVTDKIQELSNFSNIIVKFGRFVPNQEPKFDEVLGITLASPNQYGKKIS